MTLPPQLSTVGRRLSGAAVSVATVVVVTGAVYALRPVAPILSLGVLYVIAVVVVALLRGLAYAIPVSVASMLTFNFLFLPPRHTFRLEDSANWVALAVYLATAVVVSELATRGRRLARQAADAAALRESDAVKTAILRAVGHDLRSPLTAIRAASDGLASASLALTDEDRAELLETVALEARRLERLVGNLLDLSRLEAGVAQTHRELWTPDALVAQALEQLGPEAARVSVWIAPELTPLHVDAVQVERVLVNLLENALAVTPPRERVELDAEPAEGGERALLRVRDGGPGVPAADRERIFEPFERARADGRGTGLGLAIARGFARANGGRVWLEATTGTGATFVLELPLGERAVAIAT